jgi:acyl carrier protein
MTRSEIETDIRKLLSKVTKRDVSRVPASIDLTDAIALDSLGRLELLAEIEDKYDLFLTDVEVNDAKTINDITKIAEQHILEEA